jgi:hypothetical protein
MVVIAVTRIPGRQFRRDDEIVLDMKTRCEEGKTLPDLERI